MSVEEVEEFLLGWLANSVDHRDWDWFENCKMQDSRLESIRNSALSLFGHDNKYVMINYVRQTDMLTQEGEDVIRDLVSQCRMIKRETI